VKRQLDHRKNPKQRKAKRWDTLNAAAHVCVQEEPTQKTIPKGAASGTGISATCTATFLISPSLAVQFGLNLCVPHPAIFRRKKKTSGRSMCHLKLYLVYRCVLMTPFAIGPSPLKSRKNHDHPFGSHAGLQTLMVWTFQDHSHHSVPCFVSR
jgi:hypothetical protein